MRTLIRLTAALATLAPGFASGAAFQLREGDPDWTANAFAGIAAKAYDAGTVWNNPAGMVLVQGTEIDSGVNYFDPGIRFSGQNIVNGQPVPGSNGGDAGPPAVTAGSEFLWDYSPDLKFGAALEVPFGLRTSYEPNFVGRYQSLVSFIENFQLAFAAAYRVTPQFSIGGGPVVSYFRARLTQDVNTSAFGGDTNIDVRGDDYEAGYHLGALYQFTPEFRVGIDYHSRLGADLTGKQQATIPASIRAIPPVASILNALNENVTSQVALPDYATISAYWAVTPDLALMATEQWTDWSLIREITFNVPTGAELTPVNFRDTYMESVGANWRPEIAPKLLLQAGILYDSGANTNATRGVRLPDEDRLGLTGGFHFALTPKMEFRMSYLHEFGIGGNNVRYSNGFPSAGTLIGVFNNNADVVSAGIRTVF